MESSYKWAYWLNNVNLKTYHFLQLKLIFNISPYTTYVTCTESKIKILKIIHNPMLFSVFKFIYTVHFLKGRIQLYLQQELSCFYSRFLLPNRFLERLHLCTFFTTIVIFSDISDISKSLCVTIWEYIHFGNIIQNVYKSQLNLKSFLNYKNA